MADLGTQLGVARKAGYSDDDIVAYLAKDPSLGPKVAQAQAAGYGSGEIVDHLTTPAQPAQSAKPSGFAGWLESTGIAPEYHAASQAYRSDLKAATHNPDGSIRSPSPMDEAKVVGDAASVAFSPIMGPLHKQFGQAGGDAISMAIPFAGELNAAREVGVAAKAAGMAPEAMKATLAASKAGQTAAPAAVAATKVAGLKDPAGTLDALKQAKTAAYDASEAAGLQYTPEAFGRLVASTKADLAAQSMNKMRTPKAASMLDDMQALQKGGHTPTMKELDQLRQVVQRDVAGASDGSEQYMGRRIINQIDKFTHATTPADLASGDPQAASLIGAARDANTRYRKVETVLDAVDRAKLQAGSTGSGGNIDNALRQKLRGVLQNTPNLTPEEQGLLREIVVGSPGQNVMRTVGKLSPQGNGLMAALNLGGAALGGPAGAIPGAIGIVAKHLGDTATTRKIDALVQLMAKGGAPVAKAAPRVAPRPIPYQPNALAAAAPAMAAPQALNALALPARAVGARSTNPQR